MDGENQTGQDVQATSPNPEQDSEKPNGLTTLEDALSELSKVRKESAGRRVEIKGYQSQLEALEARLQSLEKGKDKVTETATDKTDKQKQETEYLTKAEFEALSQKLEALEQANQEAEKAKAQAEMQALKLKVATEYKLDPDLADRLIGDTLEQLQEDAQKLASKFAKSAPRGVLGAGGLPQGKTMAQAIYDRKRGQQNTLFDTDGHKRVGGGIHKPEVMQDDT